MPEVLLTGVSMRSAAWSAVRAGYHTVTLDAFADLDLPGVKARVDTPGIGGGFNAGRASDRARQVEADIVMYGSGFEDDPGAVDSLSSGRTLWGNPSPVLRLVRSPRALLGGLGARGFAVPRLFTPSEDGTVPPTDVAWLEKPIRSGGGFFVRRWRQGADVSSGCYLEEFIDGAPGSIVFVAAGGRAVPLGISRQLAGDWAFGASGYRYCGSILSHPAGLFDSGVAVASVAHALAVDVAREYSLVGLNNLDFIANHGVAYPIEINPRWSASVELIERAHGFSMFGLHADACSRGTLPDDRLPLCMRRAVGKAVVFAKSAVIAGETRAWLWQRDVADVPPPGSWILAGRPICTIFAEAEDHAACYRALVRRATAVYEEVRRWRAPLFMTPLLEQAFDVLDQH